MNVKELMIAQHGIADAWAEQARYHLACGDTERCTDCGKLALNAAEAAISYFHLMPAQERQGLMERLQTLYLAAATMALWSGDYKKARVLARLGLNSGAGKDLSGAMQRILDLVDKETVAAPEPEMAQPKQAAIPRTPQEERDTYYASQGFTKVPNMATGEYMPGIPDPRTQPVTPLFSQRQRAADTYLKEAQAGGLDTKAWIAYYNHLADLTGMTAVINVSDTDIELNNIRSAALKLLKLGIANIAALNDLVKAWKAENGWRKGGISPNMLVEYQSKIATAKNLEKEDGLDNSNELLNVELALKLPDGMVIWQPYKMTRKVMDERIADGYKLRIAQA